jgi:hypothetical protein
MKLKEIFIGILLGIISTIIGTFFLVKAFTNYDYFYAISIMKNGSNLSKLLALGAVLNILLVFYLFQKNKDEIAKGVIYFLILLFITTFFV